MEGKKDFEIIARQIFRMGIDDYIKLQHPGRRRKKNLREAWWTAVDLFFDPTFRFANILNELDQPMSLTEFLQVAADRENIDVKRLQDYLVEEAKNYWRDKDMRTVEIPTDIVIEGNVYQVKLASVDEYRVIYPANTILLPAKAHRTVQEEQFTAATFEIVAYHTEAKLTKKARQQLAEGWFRTLKINNCFVGD